MLNNLAFNADKTLLTEALSNIQGVISNRNVIAILNNVMLIAEGDIINGTLTITGTNMDVSVSETIKAEVMIAGTLTVNAKALFDIARKAPEEAMSLRGDADTGKLQVKCGKSRFSMPCVNSDEFPNIERGDLTHTIPITSASFIKVLNKAKFAAATEEVKYNVNGVHIYCTENGFTGDACNGIKLARIFAPNALSEFPAVTIPLKTVHLLSKIITKPSDDFTVMVSKTKICVKYRDCILVSKLIDGLFPDLDRAFPRGESKEVILNRELLIKAIDRVALSADDTSNSIGMNFSRENLTLFTSSESRGDAAEDIEIVSSFDEFKIYFNSIHLLEILNNISGINVQLSLRDRMDAVIIADPENKDEIYLISPMRK